MNGGVQSISGSHNPFTTPEIRWRTKKVPLRSINYLKMGVSPLNESYRNHVTVMTMFEMY